MIVFGRDDRDDVLDRIRRLVRAFPAEFTTLTAAILAAAAIGLAVLGSGCAGSVDETSSEKVGCEANPGPEASTVYHLGCDRYDDCSNDDFVCWNEATREIPQMFENDERMIIRSMYGRHTETRDRTWVVEPDGSGRLYVGNSWKAAEREDSCSTIPHEWERVARTREGRFELRVGPDRWQSLRSLRRQSRACQFEAKPVATPPGPWATSWNAGRKHSSAAGRSVAVDGTEAVYVGGTRHTGSDKGGVVRRYGTDGTLDWNVPIASFGDVADTVHDVELGPDGDVFAVGGVGNRLKVADGEYVRGGFIARLSPTGSIRWIRSVGTSWKGSAGRRLAIDAAGRIFVLSVQGDLEHVDYGEQPERTAYLSRLSPSGRRVWRTTVEPWAKVRNVCGVTTAHGRVVVGVTTRGDSNDGETDGTANTDVGVAEYSTLGTHTRSSRHATEDPTVCRDIAIATEMLYVVGSRPQSEESESYDTDYSDAFVTAIDPSGRRVWRREVSGPKDDVATGVTIAGSGAIRIVGTSSACPSERTEFLGWSGGWLATYNREGILENRHWIDSLRRDDLRGLAVDGEGSTYFVGSTTGYWSDGASTGAQRGLLGRID